MVDSPETSSEGESGDDGAETLASSLKGDAIGETMYSERFVLKTMLKLAKIEWNDELEDDLCSLWDMSTEADVVRIFQEHQFADIALHVVVNNGISRLREILIGTVANMCCSKEACQQVLDGPNSQAYFELVMENDAAVLIQILRLFQGQLYHADSSEFAAVIRSADILARLFNILSAAKNLDLLRITLTVLDQSLPQAEADVFRPHFYSDLNDGFKEVFKSCENDLELTDRLDGDLLKTFADFVRIFAHLCDHDAEAAAGAAAFLGCFETLNVTLSFSCPAEFFAPGETSPVNYLDVIYRHSKKYVNLSTVSLLALVKLLRLLEENGFSNADTVRELIGEITRGLSRDELRGVFASLDNSQRKEILSAVEGLQSKGNEALLGALKSLKY